jgi:hypothetical protein
MQYLFCRAFAEKHGIELRIDPWVGEQVFQIEHARPDGRLACRVNEYELVRFGDRSHLPESVPLAFPDLEFRGYAQMQICADHYTKRQAQAWLKLRPEIETGCANAVIADCDGIEDRIVCHRRVGDYIGYGYPVVSPASYRKAAERFGLHWESRHLSILTEEEPTPHTGFLPDDLGFMADFYRMMVAPTLLRANSSFSWLAALLGDGLVLSPIVDGLEGGKQHDCAFVAGNHPRFAPHLDFVTDLYVST